VSKLRGRRGVVRGREVPQSEGIARRNVQRRDAVAGIHEGVDARESGAFFPGGDAAVRLRDSAIQAIGEEHRAAHNAVRAVESVDGEAAYFGDDRIVASGRQAIGGTTE